jgi:iron-sulfur cluster assembly protein
MALKLTERAAKELKRLFAEKNKPESTIVRLGVAGGGCSGFEYRLEFADSTARDDQISESQGLRLAVDPRSAKLVDGTEIDFHDDLLKRAFVFHNPMAVKTCGCGTSFKA